MNLFQKGEHNEETPTYAARDGANIKDEDSSDEDVESLIMLLSMAIKILEKHRA